MQKRRAIIEIQQGDERANYGDAVLDKLSQKLTNEFGKGFSLRNLRTMRKFYLMYSIWKTVSAKYSDLQIKKILSHDLKNSVKLKKILLIFLYLIYNCSKEDKI